MNRNDAQRRLQMLKTMTYRAQYVEWSKLLHLHAAILAMIETGIATWDSNFEQVEKMVLENPGKVDWSSKLGLRQPRTSGKNTGGDRPSNARISGRGMTGILCGGARTFSPAHVISQLLIQRTYVVGRSVWNTYARNVFRRTGQNAATQTHRQAAHTDHDSTHINPRTALRSAPPPYWHVNGKRWMFRTRLNIARQWPRGGAGWWTGRVRETWMWNQMGGQECHEASGCVQMVECLTPMQMCGSGEKDQRTEDTGGSDPEFGDLEEVGDMMEWTRGGTSRVDEDED